VASHLQAELRERLIRRRLLGDSLWTAGPLPLSTLIRFAHDAPCLVIVKRREKLLIPKTT
jgi:hypothetical protein